MSNARFPNKAKLTSDYATLQAIIRHFENGGVITVVPSSKRPKRGFTLGNPKLKAKG